MLGKCFNFFKCHEFETAVKKRIDGVKSNSYPTNYRITNIILLSYKMVNLAIFYLSSRNLFSFFR